MKLNKLTKSAVVLSVAAVLAVPTFAATSASAASKADTWTSAEQAGGLKGLAAACKKEGQLNIIATPRDWANYGEIIDNFKKLYKVKIDSNIPDGSSQDEIDTANKLKGTKRSPDVFDLGTAVGYKYIDTHYAPYKVINWAQIPDSLKDSQGRLTPNYTGVMTVGYDGALGTITKLDDLLDAKFKGVVALNGDPTKASAGLNGLFMTSIANGGSFDDISKGVDFFKKLKAAGNFINVDPTPATIESGQTRVVFDWTYNAKSVIDKFKAVGKTWKTFTPANAAVGSFYNVGVSKWAPHPACGRLWMEYVLSPAGGNSWGKGGASPVLWPWMIKNKTASADAIAVIGSGTAVAKGASLEQQAAANAYLTANWAAAVGTR
ncbi:MAG: ABC transporter substrate-binding protein [Acidobacteria bacterium]|nr:ABC transporter substrate-binding protein [Acidobacteriota bacterium]